MRCDSAAAPEQVDLACARAPIGLLAELTHRCPLQCPVPTRWSSSASTPSSATGNRVGPQLGILQIHLSGGEPTVQRDLEEIIKAAADAGLYTNLSRRASDARPLVGTKEAVSTTYRFPSRTSVSPPMSANRVGQLQGGGAKKRIVAGWVRDLGMPLTINAPIHRHDVERRGDPVRSRSWRGPHRVAHVQYYAWALRTAPR